MLNSKKVDSPILTYFSLSLFIPLFPLSLPFLVLHCFFLTLFSLPIFNFVFVPPSRLAFLSLFLCTLRIYKSLTHPSTSCPPVLALFLSVLHHCILCLLAVCWLVCNLETPAPTVLRLSHYAYTSFHE